VIFICFLLVEREGLDFKSLSHKEIKFVFRESLSFFRVKTIGSKSIFSPKMREKGPIYEKKLPFILQSNIDFDLILGL